MIASLSMTADERQTQDGHWRVQERALRLSVAFVWAATAVLVLHPQYRAIGSQWLGRIGLPDALMWATCAGEAALAVWMAVSPTMSWRLAALQTALIGGFTIILAVAEPTLLAHPLGMLTKNIPMLGVIWVAFLLPRQGWSPRAQNLLRGSVAIIWLTEGLLPKILMQSPLEIAIVENLGLSASHASTLIYVAGAGQIAAGVGVLLLRGRALRWLLAALIAALVLLPLLATAYEWRLWLHPFGPLTKNVPMLVATIVMWWRCSR